MSALYLNILRSEIRVQVYEGDDWINEDHLRSAESQYYDFDLDLNDEPEPLQSQMFRCGLLFRPYSQRSWRETLEP